MGRYHLGKGYRRCFGLWNSGGKRITSKDFLCLFLVWMKGKGSHALSFMFYVLCFAFPITFSRHGLTKGSSIFDFTRLMIFFRFSFAIYFCL